MRQTYKFSLLLLSTSVFLGCSNKPFTLQSYADKYFNEKPAITEEQKKAIATTSVEEDQSILHSTQSSSAISEKTNAAIKSGPGSDIAWSSTYKQDKATQGQGALQKNLDEWTKEEWEPAFEGDEKQAEKDKAANENFTLQHYVDKAAKYMKHKEELKAGQPQEPAHYEKMEKLPVIGK